MKLSVFFLGIILTLFVNEIQAAELVKIMSKDGIEITADLYKIHDETAPFIILFHQAGWSRGEYQEIAPQLNALGFNCLAIDQRSGKSVNGVDNMTFVNANKAMKQTGYIDAYQDIEPIIAHVREYFTKGKIILWGSSYSSSLVLKYAGDNPESVSAVLAFSPGEYFKNFGKPGDFIQQSAAKIKCPSFITSGRSEKNGWWSIHQAIAGDKKEYFLPETSGNHGSRALWSKFTDSKDYWVAVKNFLKKVG